MFIALKSFANEKVNVRKIFMNQFHVDNVVKCKRPFWSMFYVKKYNFCSKYVIELLKTLILLSQSFPCFSQKHNLSDISTISNRKLQFHHYILPLMHICLQPTVQSFVFTLKAHENPFSLFITIHLHLLTAIENGSCNKLCNNLFVSTHIV